MRRIPSYVVTSYSLPSSFTYSLPSISSQKPYTLSTQLGVRNQHLLRPHQPPLHLLARQIRLVSVTARVSLQRRSALLLLRLWLWSACVGLWWWLGLGVLSAGVVLLLRSRSRLRLGLGMRERESPSLISPFEPGFTFVEGGAVGVAAAEGFAAERWR